MGYFLHELIGCIDGFEANQEPAAFWELGIGTGGTGQRKYFCFLTRCSQLIPLELSIKYPEDWRREEKENEKDIVCLKSDRYSIELKTSSSKRSIYGNRSYAQKSTTGKVKKNKNGYYLAINFEKFSKPTATPQKPLITLVRFGWLDEHDWQAQTAATGQQARLSADVERYKLLKLPTTN